MARLLGCLLAIILLVALYLLALTSTWQAEELEKQNSRLLDELAQQQQLVEAYQSETAKAIGNVQYSIHRNSENIDALHSRVREVEAVVKLR